MARIAGVDLPRDKRIEIGLTYIFGIGRALSNDILAATGASSATISRVNRSLNDYGTGAYRAVFQRMEEKNK